MHLNWMKNKKVQFMNLEIAGPFLLRLHWKLSMQSIQTKTRGSLELESIT